jgi:hypothetical protein
MAVFERFNQTPLDSAATEIQVALISDILIAGNPGETFLTFADRTAALLPGNKVLTTGYTNEYVGYIPAADRYDVSGRQFRRRHISCYGIRGEFRFREDVGDSPRAGNGGATPRRSRNQPSLTRCKVASRQGSPMVPILPLVCFARSSIDGGSEKNL